MWILEEGQILPYLRSHYPVFDQSGTELISSA